MNPAPPRPISSLRRIAGNSTAIFISRIIDMLYGMASVALLTRYLGKELYGQYTWIWAYVFFLQPVVNFELDKILIREIAANPSRAAQYIGQTLKLKWLFSAGFCLLIGLSAPWMIEPSFYLAVIFAVASELAFHHCLLFNGAFNGFERMDFEAYLTIISRTIALGLIVGCVWLDLGFTAIFMIVALGNIVKGIGGYLLLSGKLAKIELTRGLRDTKQLVHEAAPLALAAFLTHTAFKMDIYVLKYFDLTEAISLFHVPHLMIMQVQIIPLALVGAIFPVLSRTAASDPVKFREIVQGYGVAFLFGGTILALMLALPAKYIILLLAGEKFLPAAAALRILSWTIPVLFLNFLLSTSLISLKKQRYIPISSAVTVGVNLVADVLLVPRYEFIGASYGTLLAYLCGLVVLVVIVVKSGEGQ